MRVVICCLLIGEMFWIAPSYGKDQQGWNPPPANFRDNLNDYKHTITDPKDKTKFDIPGSIEIPQNSGDYTYSPQKIHGWWVSAKYTTAREIDKCEMHAAAEGRWSIFRAFEPRVTYTATVSGSDELSIYLPSQPHSKGTPVAFVDSQAFGLSLTTARTFVPDPKTQKKMVQAMKTGKAMIVKWVEADGTRWEDRYPLIGISEAFAEFLRLCP